MIDCDRRKSFRLLSHTADLRLEVRGADLPGVFRNAIRALYALLDLPLTVRTPPATPGAALRIQALDAEDALVRLLGELLYRAESDRSRIEPESITLRQSAEGVVMEVLGDWHPVPAADGKKRHEIKAVTYHGAGIREVFGGLLAEVVLDV